MKTAWTIKTVIIGATLASSTCFAKSGIDYLSDLLLPSNAKQFCSNVTSHQYKAVSLKSKILNENSKGDLIVFLTDNDLDDSQYMQFAKFLAIDHKVLLFNHRGLMTRRTEEMNFSTKTFSRDLSNLLSSLNMNDKVILVGHGYSSRVALQFAEENQDKVLSVISLDHDLVKKESAVESLSCRQLYTEFERDFGVSLYRRSLLGESMSTHIQKLGDMLIQMTSTEFIAKKDVVLEQIKNRESVKRESFVKHFIAPSKVEKNKLWPLGSAVITQSGNLHAQGIRAIIHAASGSMVQSGVGFDPTLDSIVLSVKNSIQLAIDNNYKSIAIPLVGGGIFLRRSGATMEELMRGLLKAGQGYQGRIKIAYVMYDDSSYDNLVSAKESLKISENDGFKLVKGSITDFNVHKCETIVNAANTELQFGGGLSGAIGQATGQAGIIDSEAEALLQNQ